MCEPAWPSSAGLLGVVETIAEEKRKVFTQMLATENSLITFAVGLRNLSHSTD